jgi:hypothetical protein
LFGRHGKLRSPRLSVAGGFMPALHDFFGQSRVKIDRCAYHVRGDFDLSAVEHVQVAEALL